MAARPKGSSKQRPGRRKYATRRRIPWLPIGGLVVVLVAGFFLLRSLELGAPGERISVSGVGQHPPEGQPIAYKEVPPVGGPHWPSAASWGFSPAVPDERAVHNLEHGGIVVSYNLIAQADLDRIRLLLTTYPRDRYGEVKLLIRPYEQIPPGTFVLAAWGWRQSFSAYDDAAVRAFMDAHLNRCCENVP